MTPIHRNWTRREILQASGLITIGLVAGCASEPETPGTGDEPAGAATPEPKFTEPASQLSGALSILMWSHFVPSHDQWFDQFAREWGEQAGVTVTVDHINVA